MEGPRILMVAFSIQGMINPALVLARRLATLGVEVTFVTALHAHRRITTAASPLITFAPFSDGHDDNFDPTNLDLDLDRYDSDTFRLGSQALSDLVAKQSSLGKPFSCIIHTPVVIWAAHVAEEFYLPAVLLWVQSATSFDLGYSYYHSHRSIIDTCFASKSFNKTLTELNFLGLPFDIEVRDLPNYMDASSPQAVYAKYHLQVFEKLGRSSSVLVNTVEALEAEALRAVVGGEAGLNLIDVGPLADDMLHVVNSDQSSVISEWLNSKARGSVVYVSFGSLSVLARAQMEEMARAMLEFERPFLWVVRDGERPKWKIEELEKLGMFVEWCNQVEVLGSGALACFVSHCGWNSTLESLVCGVPVVGFPQRIDQLTNAKLVQDYWKVGVRVKTDASGSAGVVESEEIKRCLEAVVVGGDEFRSNANKWKGLAREAIVDGGSSDINLRAFVNEMMIKS